MFPGHRIRHMRIQRGETQQEFAEALGVAQSTIAHWEGSSHAPSTEHLVRVLAYCGATAGQFWADDFPKSLPPHLQKAGK